MERAKSSVFRKGTKVGFVLILWLITAWLLYPLIILDSVNIKNAKEYLYRSAVGIAIMLILFGKTIFDLLFPQAISKKMSLLNTIFLTLYCMALASGIIFMVSRMIVLYLKRGDSGFPF
ncbi:MAG: hypothetical protein ACETWK_04550 [Candidatus Aminicenantaceae bacterium]